MLVNLFRLLRGYVEFSFAGGFNEGFVNSCFKEKLDIKNVKAADDALTAQCDIKTYKKLHKVAFKHGGRVRILKKKGLPFLTYPLKNRPGIYVGMLFFVLYISFMGGFIWNITITGNNRLEAAQIIDYLNKNGVKIGARWSQIDKESIEFGVLADFDDVSWISINKFGSTAAIEINEAVAEPDVIDVKSITNVIADRDGVITHITALGGLPVVKAGEAVTKGDLLISGVYESEADGLNHYTHAHGTALAKTEELISLNISRHQHSKNYTQSRQYKSIRFFGLRIPLYLKKLGGEAESTVEKSRFILNSTVLPIEFVTETKRYYEITDKLLTDGELEKLAISELSRRKETELSDCTIIDESVRMNTSESGCLITGKYSCIADIGKERAIQIDEKSDDN